ncbi:hypothetical protein DFP73DRAFT_484544, partial [Morchella snyderi]
MALNGSVSKELHIRDRRFHLRAHLCLVSADMVAREKLMKVTGNRSYCYCEYCLVRCVWNCGLYCPMSSPMDAPRTARERKESGYPWTDWDRDHLPMRSNEELRRVATQIAQRGANTKQISKYGVKGLSILSQLKSIDFPRSFPPDSMHLWFENIIPDLVKHWRGKYRPKVVQTDDEYNIALSDWEWISSDIATSSSTFPALFGSVLRNFLEHVHELTASEWQTFTILLAPVYLKEVLPNEDYNEYISLVEAIQIACDHILTVEEICEV